MEGRNYCKDCGRMFGRKDALKRHKERKHSLAENPFYEESEEEMIN